MIHFQVNLTITKAVLNVENCFKCNGIPNSIQLISREDLSKAHRIPTKKGGPRPIVAKFVRRETRDNVMV